MFETNRGIGNVILFAMPISLLPEEVYKRDYAIKVITRNMIIFSYQYSGKPCFLSDTLLFHTLLFTIIE